MLMVLLSCMMSWTVSLPSGVIWMPSNTSLMEDSTLEVRLGMRPPPVKYKLFIKKLDMDIRFYQLLSIHVMKCFGVNFGRVVLCESSFKVDFILDKGLVL